VALLGLLMACQQPAISSVNSPSQDGAIAAAPKVDVEPDFEAKVLQVLRDNPQVILESVSRYNQEQASRRDTFRQTFAELVQADPTKVVGESPVLGSLNDSVVLIEFSDFQCPFCARSQAPLKQFMAEAGDRVALVFKHFPLNNIHPHATPAAKASWAAQQQGKFWEYHDRLFANPERLGESLYTEIARELGLDLGRFNRDRQSEAAAAAIQADLELATSLGLEGTPTFLMNGVPLGGPPTLDTFRAALARAAS
jgi:protein-disulfide isomerase